MQRPALLLLVMGLAGVAPAKPPNVVLIVSDDQRPDTIRALGHPMIETPHLDQLVARGTVFTRAVAAYPICHASRAELLTGCTLFRAYPQYPGGRIDPALATLAGTFQTAGYRTCYTGKWHNDGHPKQRGYTITSGLFSGGGAPGPRPPATDTQGHPVTGYTGWTFKTDDGRVETDKGVGLTPITSEHIADGAIAFLRRKHDQPFLLHIGFSAPHDPRLMPPGYAGRYDPARIALPGNFAPVHPFDHGNGAGRDEQLLPRPLREEDVRAELACYYAVITHLDAQIGRIFAALAAAGLESDTLVVFTSDQGLALGSHGLLGKQNMYEHTVGVPLIIAGPGWARGTRSDAQCYLRDLFPTLCDLAGIAIPSTVQGRSLAPVLRGSIGRVHPFVVAYFTDTQRMIRDDRWKLVRYPKAQQTQLFDLAADPLERVNLAGEPVHQATRERLDRTLAGWLRENGDPAARP